MNKLRVIDLVMSNNMFIQALIVGLLVPLLVAFVAAELMMNNGIMFLVVAVTVANVIRQYRPSVLNKK